MAAEHKPAELIGFGKQAVKAALKMGANEAEAFLSVSSGTSIDIERGQIVRSAKRMDQGLGVRAVYRKAVGFSYTNTLTDKSIEEAAERAFRAARASKPDKNWVKFPCCGKFGEARGTYDKRVADLSSDEMVDVAAVMLSAVEAYDKRVLAVDGGVGASLFGEAVVNSLGVEVCDVGTAVACSVETIARDGADVTPACYEVNTERMYNIDPEAVGTEAARQAVSCLGAKKIGSGTFPVVFAECASFIAVLHVDKCGEGRFCSEGAVCVCGQDWRNCCFRPCYSV